MLLRGPGYHHKVHQSSPLPHSAVATHLFQAGGTPPACGTINQKKKANGGDLQHDRGLSAAVRLRAGAPVVPAIPSSRGGSTLSAAGPAAARQPLSNMAAHVWPSPLHVTIRKTQHSASSRPQGLGVRVASVARGAVISLRGSDAYPRVARKVQRVLVCVRCDGRIKSLGPQRSGAPIQASALADILSLPPASSHRFL
ncbi:hypothetical protein NDU88_006533 [Pleurodeles waltl]|uniref:Uncharacterized protein n=1 Tax=Pleurodeles waltl TaxID=8319 RepID=A0AAV7TXX2_PLEWA|nr:hypothetical protein NDU88_006533 [Pleurodeles waltl]